MPIPSLHHGSGRRRGSEDGFFLAGALGILIMAIVLSLAAPWR
jgi:hypothetical protein